MATEFILKLFLGIDIEIYMKFGPQFKWEIDRGLKSKVFYVLRGETGSYPSTHLLQGTPIDRGPITG
jgi:hypothetical protein